MVMGNTTSQNGERLATAAVANYMSLTKAQLLQLREACRTFQSKRNKMIKRKYFHFAVDKVNSVSKIDREILDLLFTMWDLTGDNRVPCKEFIVSLSPLACHDDNLASAFRFGMTLMDEERRGMISAYETMTLLKCINSTACYFGDRALGLRQIYKIVDSVFDTITMISQDAEDMTHDECLILLMQEPLMQDLCKKNHLSISPTTSADESEPFVKTRLEDESEFSTDVSSVMLTPLAQQLRVPESYFNLKYDTLSSRSTLSSDQYELVLASQVRVLKLE